jgi:hypothetical protein
MNKPKLYLVEEHANELCYGPETIQWHKVVVAEGHMEAFRIAEQFHRDDRNHDMCTWIEPGTWSFAFFDDDLEVYVPSYAWAANDGSSIWYEVRLLGAVKTHYDNRTGETSFAIIHSTTPERQVSANG